jgi:hypothetical protein
VEPIPHVLDKRWEVCENCSTSKTVSGWARWPFLSCANWALSKFCWLGQTAVGCCARGFHGGVVMFSRTGWLVKVACSFGCIL